MFNRIHIQNIQSHKDTKLEFHPGFNSIVGSTDSGKSAIYRSIHWARFNKIVTSFISFWNRKKDGTPVDPSSVSLTTSSGILTRERSSNLNGYRINEQDPLEAVGRGEPPEQVLKLLNISDINFFSQHNPPFLLTKSAGEVATILNDLIHLSDIDRVLSNIGRLKKTNKEKLDQVAESVASLTTELNTLSWVNTAKEALEQAEAGEDELNIVDSRICVLVPLYEAYTQNSKAIESIESICNQAIPLIASIEQIDKELEEVVRKYAELDQVATSLKQIEENIKILKELDVSEDIEKYDNIQNELDEITGSIDEFTNWLIAYNAKEQLIEKTEIELTEVIKELNAIPVCSECGRPLEDCDD